MASSGGPSSSGPERVKLLIDAKKDEAKGRIGADNFAFLEQAARIAVQFAEQAGLSGKIKDEAQAKFDLALATVQKMADDKGIKVDLAIVTALIEASVRMGMHKRFDDNPAVIVKGTAT